MALGIILTFSEIISEFARTIVLELLNKKSNRRGRRNRKDNCNKYLSSPRPANRKLLRTARRFSARAWCPGETSSSSAVRDLLFRRRSGPGTCRVWLSGGHSGRPVPRACSRTRRALGYKSVAPYGAGLVVTEILAPTPQNAALSRVSKRPRGVVLYSTFDIRHSTFGCGRSPRKVNLCCCCFPLVKYRAY